MHKTYIIIGASAAGMGAITKLKQLDPDGRIICISGEKELPYNKCFLADYVGGGKGVEQLALRPADYFDTNGIELMLGAWVTSIDADGQKVHLADGQAIGYDKLLIATGSRPIKPVIEGLGCEGVYYFHDFSDINQILSYAHERQVRRALVIGAGLTGLEAADALAKLGIAVSVVDQAQRILARQVDPDGSQFLYERMQAAGNAFYLNDRVTGICGTRTVVSAELASGTTVGTDMVVVAIGTRANSQLAAQAGCRLHNQGVLVDRHLATDVSNIWAAGDVAVVPDMVTGEPRQSCLWPDAMLQGMTAAHAMTGKPKEYPGMFLLSTSQLAGLDIALCGSVGDRHNIIQKRGDQVYRSFTVQGPKLTGFCLIGDTASLPLLRRAVITGQSVDLDDLYPF